MSLDLRGLRNARLAADGAWTTQLWTRGVTPGSPAELANVEQPQLVEALAREYVDAGARFLTTNTFAANRFNLARGGATRDVREVNLAGARIARRVADESPRAAAVVVGSIGPSGKIMAVREAPEEELRAAFAEQARALSDGGVEAVVLETFSELAEIVLALRTVKEVCGLPVIACMSFDSGPQRTRTTMGVEAGEAAAALEQAGADLVGLNCGSGIAFALPALVALRAACKLPLWVKPSAGLPELEHGCPVFRQTPEEFAEHVPMLFQAGASVVGGCCGTGPEHVRRVAQAARRRPR